MFLLLFIWILFTQLGWMLVFMCQGEEVDDSSNTLDELN